MARRDSHLHSAAVAVAEWNGATGRASTPAQPRAIRNRNILEQLQSCQAELEARTAELKCAKTDLAQAAHHEQERISAELHDGLGQTLTGLSLLLHAVLMRAMADASPYVGELRQLDHIAAESIAGCRAVVHGLSPLTEHGGLALAVEELVANAIFPEGPRINLVVTGSAPNRLSDGASDHLYRIVQESLHNAIKHSQAHTIQVSLDFQHDVIAVVVQDDGIGFLSGVKHFDSHGLQSLRHRADAINARLSIEEGVVGGTHICCECPQPA